MTDTAQTTPFDPDALRERYRRERDKRLRPDGNAQYVEIGQQHSEYLDDPYIETPIVRQPLSDEVDVVIVGGGFGGLLAGARLRQAGVEDVRIIEKGGDFGGTWYWNRYPGAACDIESFIYLPLLEETGYMPVEKYSRAPEIHAHSRRIAQHYGLDERALLQTEVTGMHWDDESNRWIVATNRQDAIKARYVVVSNGPLHRPKLPGIAGISDFQGHSFHTSRWDYDYTGGDISGNLHKLKDKRVGVIGTGATAVQSVPHLAAGAKELYVFQRTPSSIDKRGDGPTDPEWVKTLEPGWQQHRMDNFNALVSGAYTSEDLVNDGWTDIIRNLAIKFLNGEVKMDSPDQAGALMEMADFEKMEQIRTRVDEVVRDGETAANLKPWYRQFCKRPCFHDEYLAAFNQPNVRLVDTDGQGVERITAAGVVANGEEYPLDCLIFATGFIVSLGTQAVPPYEITGRDGDNLAATWQRDGVRSLHGIMVRGFPNAFILGGPQGGWTANYPHNLDEQARHVAHIIDQLAGSNRSCAEPRAEDEAKWVATIEDKAILRERFLAECTPGYYNNEGQPSPSARRASSYGGGSIEYFGLLEQWRQDGSMPGLEIT